MLFVLQVCCLFQITVNISHTITLFFTFFFLGNAQGAVDILNDLLVRLNMFLVTNGICLNDSPSS